MSLDHIIADLQPLAVEITTLVPDERNARKHDERNLNAIRSSLATFGQRTPLVVDQESGRVLKGNGTLEAARSLGWTHLAVVTVTDDPTTATGYAIADNRTAELATWDDDLLLELALEVKQENELLYEELLIDDLLNLGPTAEEKPAAAIAELLQVIVEVDDEQVQQELWQRLKDEGYKVKLLTL